MSRTGSLDSLFVNFVCPVVIVSHCAVSYTHLDVYKRQLVHSIPLKNMICLNHEMWVGNEKSIKSCITYLCAITYAFEHLLYAAI